MPNRYRYCGLLLLLLGMLMVRSQAYETGSCANAGFDSCCTSDSCEGQPKGSECYCDITCYLQRSCCSDMELICPDPHDPLSEAQPDPNVFLIYANRAYIHKINLNGTGFKTIARGVSPAAVGLDFHYSQRLFYWTDVSLKRIMKADFNGFNVEVVISDGIHTPDGIAVDWVSNKIYWTDTGTDKIEVYDIARKIRKELVNTVDGTGTSEPTAIVLDPKTRYMYWSDWGDVARIERASMDGTGRTTLHDTELVWPNAITVDYSSQTLYWADAHLDYIGKSATDGSNRDVLYTVTVPFHPFGLDYYNNYIIMTDWIYNSVTFVPEVGATELKILENTNLYKVGRGPNGVHVVTRNRQPNAYNPCELNNGACSHLCLLSSTNPQGYSCACPDNMIISGDGITCESPDINVKLGLSRIHILDVKPYNSFGIRCAARTTFPTTKTFLWQQSSGGIDTELNHDGTNVNITDNDSNEHTSTSHLQRTLTTAGIYSYMCTVMTDGGLNKSDSIYVNIRGATNPIQPSDVRSVVLSPFTVNILWTTLYISYTPEEYRVQYGLASNGSLDQVSKTVPGSADITSTSVLLSVELNELCAGQTYHYMIVSMNSFSFTSTDVFNFSSAQSSPQGAPQQFIADEIASTSFMLSWQPVLECLSGGTSLNYMLSCPPVLNDVILNSGANSRLVDNLTPATHYTCSIKAFNGFGSGTVASLSVTTKDGAPGPVQSVSYTVLSQTTIQVTWKKPEVDNGEISEYRLKVTAYTDGQVLFTYSINASVELTVTVENLEPLTPYGVTIHAMNSMIGEESYFIAFTKQGVPSKAPDNLMVELLDESSMNVTWNAISLMDARGFLDHYTVTYEPTNNVFAKGLTSIHVPANTTYKVIGDLDSQQSYAVTVSAYTNEGGGPIASQQVAAHCRKTIQLVLSGVHECSEWKFQDSKDKIEDITIAIVDVLKSKCDCSATTGILNEAVFLCTSDPEVVVYQAIVTGTSSIGCSEIVHLMTEWVRNENPNVLVQNNLLTVDGSCAVEIESFGNTPECVDQQEESDDKMIYIIGGAGAGAVALIILLLILISVCVYLKAKTDVNVQKQGQVDGNLPQEYEISMRHDIPPTLPPNHPRDNEHMYDYIDERKFHLALQRNKRLALPNSNLQVPVVDPEVSSVCSYVSIHSTESSKEEKEAGNNNKKNDLYLKIYAA